MMTIQEAADEMVKRIKAGDHLANAVMITIRAKVNALKIEQYNIMRAELASIDIEIPKTPRDPDKAEAHVDRHLKVVEDDG